VLQVTKQQENTNKENDKYVTDSTFEVYDQENNDEPVTNSILESYGQVGVSNEREERERQQNKEDQ
jgi:hypothetical protein